MSTLHNRTERLYYRTSELETLGGFCGPDFDNPDGLCFATHSEHSPYNGGREVKDKEHLDLLHA